MNRQFLIYVILYLFLSVHTINAQELISNESVTGVCFAGNKTTKIYIPPSEKFLKNQGSKKGGSINVYYYGFTAEAIEAFEYAKSILESMLPADTKTTIIANWTNTLLSGVLGNSTVTAVVGGWGIDAFKPLVFYPVSLAEKIAGRSLNSDQNGDIILSLNSSVNWYLGTNGQVPPGRYDLVTVILHELCHGLGFFDSMNANSTTGWYGISSLPVIYDSFIENLQEKVLTDTNAFRNYSPELLKEYTSGKLFFKGPLLKAFTNKARVSVYSPDTWSNGSSISHLDEQLSMDSGSSLMTPFIDMQEAIHDPGIYTVAILGDLGWLNTRIIHKPLEDTEDNLTEISLSVEIQSDTTFKRDKVALVYSFNGFKNSDTVFMSSPGADKYFSANLNVPSYNSELQYFFFTEDIFHRTFRSPSLYQLFRFKSFIGADTVKPQVNHTPAEYYLETEDSVRLSVTTTDNLGIDTVYIEYRIDDGLKSFTGLKSDSADTYKIVLTAGDLMWNGGDSLKYRIFVKDSAKLTNTSVSPDTGYYSVAIIRLGDVITAYNADFTDTGNDFFLSGFEIMRPIGWLKPGLHTKHPYESPEENGKSINYIALLKNPLKFDESGLLFKYSDIALIEPGEDGAPFGSQDFYDYVVVEASKDFGKSWFSLFNGYDARFNSTWLKAYNSSIVDQNSTATGKESMFVKESVFIAPSANLKAGDIILIRFRLYSDPYAYGWGWAIQDININPLIDGIERLRFENLMIYPNPGSGIINITGAREIIPDGSPVRYEVFNTSGIPVLKGFTSGGFESVINITGFPSGMYIIILYLNDSIRTFKYSLIR